VDEDMIKAAKGGMNFNLLEVITENCKWHFIRLSLDDKINRVEHRAVSPRLGGHSM